MLLKAFAKINWSLDIVGVRPDGYHLLDMVMQPVSLADDIILLPDRNLSIETDGYPYSASDSTNLAYKAAECLRAYCGIKQGVRILLHKRIPIGAGLGGGSADAAAVLWGLNRLWKLNIASEQLESIGLSIGADVPFCLRGGLTRTRGIGENLENCLCSMNYRLLVIQPCRGLSTGAVFSAWHSSADIRHPDTDSVLKALATGNHELLSSSVYNVLEGISSSECPEAINRLLDSGAFTALMTGSGSAVFGAFRSGAAAEKAMKKLSSRYRTIHLCHTQTDSIRVMEE